MWFKLQTKLVYNCACHVKGNTPSNGDATSKTLSWAIRNLQTQCDCLLQKHRSNIQWFVFVVTWAHIPLQMVCLSSYIIGNWLLFWHRGQDQFEGQKQSKHTMREYEYVYKKIHVHNQPCKSFNKCILPDTNIVLELGHAKSQNESSYSNHWFAGAICWL